MPTSKDPEKRKRQLANLCKGRKFERHDEAARNAQKISSISQAQQRKSAERLKRWQSLPAMGDDGKPRESVFYPGETMTNAELLDLKKIDLALQGNLEALRYIDKQVGDAPSDNVAVNLSGSIGHDTALRIGFSDEAFEE